MYPKKKKKKKTCKGNLPIFTAVKGLRLGWAEIVAGIWDFVLLTRCAAFISIVQTYTNIKKPFVTNVYFRQRQFSSSVLFSLLSCNIYNELLTNINSINIRINKKILLSNNYAITSTWNLTSCLSYRSVPYSLVIYHVYSFFFHCFTVHFISQMSHSHQLMHLF